MLELSAELVDDFGCLRWTDGIRPWCNPLGSDQSCQADPIHRRGRCDTGKDVPKKHALKFLRVRGGCAHARSVAHTLAQAGPPDLAAIQSLLTQ